MKNLYRTFILLFIGGSVFGQSFSERKAEKLFLQRAYMDAAEMYRLAADKDQEILQNLADSYFYTNRMNDAVDTYRLLMLRHEAEVAPEYKFRFAHALRATGANVDADKYMSEYLGQEINFEQWEKELDTTVVHTYTTDQVMNNASSSDFGISYMGDQIVFASTRNEARPIYEWNREPYLDLYVADISDEGELSNITLFPGEINTDTHESSATFSEDGNTMFFDRTNSRRVKIEGSEVPVATIRIYRAELVDGVWTNIEALPFTSDQFSTEHPTLSADGTTLYFSSDMPGSLGSFDIYSVAVNEDGTFGEPVNLGPNVNTPEREQFPYISDEGVLYFASNGRIGFGNLDIFRSENENGSFAEAQNLGNSLNSGHDDFAFVLKKDEDGGYFASNRRGTDNLYVFTREDYEPPVVPIELRETNVETGAQQLRDVGNIYFAFDKADIRPEAEVVLDKVVAIMKEYPELKIEIGSHADARGTDAYNLDLSKRRAASTMEYLVSQGIDQSRLTSQGYGETMPLNDCTEPTGCTAEQYAINRRSEFKIMN
ncbi:MAG TPA: OmpA family protein [Salinimicrobium sp.]|nr:OmpA family protein [Salinimicrobium sp.]